MTQELKIFTPNSDDTAAAAATTTSGSTAVALNGVGEVVRLYNGGSADAFVQFGTNAVVATTAKVPLPAGSVEAFGVDRNITHFAAITASGSATVYATRGKGA